MICFVCFFGEICGTGPITSLTLPSNAQSPGFARRLPFESNAQQAAPRKVSVRQKLFFATLPCASFTSISAAEP
jgi:hypothetical protein